MKRASYKEAVRWIAFNDNAGNGDNEAEVAEYITVALIADLYGRSTEEIAVDVMRVRDREVAE